MNRESMEFDVLIVGAGPAGLSAALRLKQLSEENNTDISIAVIEKGAEVGAHILSGAVIQTDALDDLIPDWREKNAPITTEVKKDRFYYLTKKSSYTIPSALLVPQQKNHGNYIVSLSNVCKWLGEQAENAGIDILPGFPAQSIYFNEDGSVGGVITADMGVDKNGEQKSNYQAGYLLKAKYTLFAEGCRGHLGKVLRDKYLLEKECDPQHFGIGIKELWQLPEDTDQAGEVIHTTGFPLSNDTYGGSFMYQLDARTISLGLVVGLNYKNPYLSPFDELQKLKTHPFFKSRLKGAKRIGYGARALNEGGFQSIPRLHFPGGLMIGCDAGFLNLVKIKGTHTAMRSGMIAAETVFETLSAEASEKNTVLQSYDQRIRASSIGEELYKARNAYPAFHKLGMIGGMLFTGIDQHIFRGKLPFTWRVKTKDHATLMLAKDASPIDYPKPDNVLTFDRTTSVQLSNTYHDDDQPAHLTLKDSNIPIQTNLPKYDEPATRYCPAGVYEVVEDENGKPRFQINAQNCVHCKTCDIKDPSQNITWIAPEGGGGPNYSDL